MMMHCSAPPPPSTHSVRLSHRDDACLAQSPLLSVPATSATPASGARICATARMYMHNTAPAVVTTISRPYTGQRRTLYFPPSPAPPRLARTLRMHAPPESL
ncbi:hypothetical protein C8R44DRAFT_973298 [Mycena epipterygia]|nr:hypothetical protein C8R44DRAFT_973298 [Mycena epipterygia]